MSKLIQLEKVLKHLKKDKKLNTFLEGITLPEINVNKNIYPELLNSIAGQQLSVKAAATIFQRFKNLYGNKIPNPDELLNTSVEALRAAGMSRQKSNYLHNIAEKFKAENWLERDWSLVSDEIIMQELCEIKGVGEWTVQMILMFALAREDVFAVKDLVVRKAMIEIYEPQYENNKELYQKLEEIAADWKPYRSYACHALWAWVEA